MIKNCAVKNLRGAYFRDCSNQKSSGNWKKRGMNWNKSRPNMRARKHRKSVFCRSTLCWAKNSGSFSLRIGSCFMEIILRSIGRTCGKRGEQVVQKHEDIVIVALASEPNEAAYVDTEVEKPVILILPRFCNSTQFCGALTTFKESCKK